MTRDLHVRVRAFDWLSEQTALHGDVLEWKTLLRGFDLDGQRVPLVSQQGIFKPAVCELPLSVRTSADSPYDDHFLENRLVYRYRGTDPNHHENAGLRALMREGVPLVYFHGVLEGRYLAVWPILVVGDEPQELRFWIQAESALELGGAQLTGPLEGASITDESERRRYATRVLQTRLHQRGFRERVLRAYLEQCAMCRLRRRELLDAAHIKPDTEGGEPVVPNGLALCKIHHTAFDVGVLGVHPASLLIRVRRDVLEEVDGPMLRHGLQGLNGARIKVPRSITNRPDPELLRWKWERFERAG